MTLPVTVTGVAENQHALLQAGKVDTTKGAHEAGLALLPFVQGLSATDTGIFRGGWDVEGDAFINTVSYSGYAEYGTQFMEGSNALRKAVDSHEESLTKAFDKVTDDSIRKAGYRS